VQLESSRTGMANMKIAVTILEVPSGTQMAHCPALPGCVAIGKSRHQAARRITSAIAGYFASFDSVPPERIELQLSATEGPLRTQARQEVLMALS